MTDLGDYKMKSDNEALRRLKRIGLAMLGQIICGFGMYLQIQAQIGLSPWIAFYQGLSLCFPISYGTACNLLGVLVVLADIALKEPSGVGMLLDAFLLGWTSDFLIKMNPLPAQTKLIFQILVLILGIFAICIGELFYMRAALGCGPRDALVIALGKRIKKITVGKLSIIVSTIVLVLAYFLGASIGIGTVISIVFTGFIMDLVFSIAKFNAYEVKHENFFETMRVFYHAYLNRKPQ